MTILVQRESRAPRDAHERFETLGRERAWPLLLHFGAQMVAYGTWEFGGPGDVLVSNTCYEDFDHWLATRPDGALHRHEAMIAEVRDLVGALEQCEALVESSSARVFELNDAVSRPRPFRRRPGEHLPDPLPGFGRGSVVSERTLALAEGQRGEFTRISSEVVWPWLERQGGHLIGIGHDLMGAASEVTTWFAFPSLADWHRFARPATANAPSEVVDAFNARAALVRDQRGRLLTVGTDWGAPHRHASPEGVPR